jgi:hypothetical protein
MVERCALRGERGRVHAMTGLRADGAMKLLQERAQ